MRFTCWPFVEDQYCSSPTGSSLIFSALAFGESRHIHSFMFYTPQSYPCFLFWQLLVSADNSCDPVLVMFNFAVLSRPLRFVYLYPVAIVRVRRCVRACVCIGATVKLKQQFLSIWSLSNGNFIVNSTQTPKNDIPVVMDIQYNNVSHLSKIRYFVFWVWCIDNFDYFWKEYSPYSMQ